MCSCSNPMSNPMSNPDDAFGAPYRVTTQSVNLNVFRSLMNNGTYLTQNAERIALFASNLASYNCNAAMNYACNLSNVAKASVWASNMVLSNQQKITTLLNGTSNWNYASNAIKDLSNVAYAASNAALYGSTLAFAVAQREPDWNYASNMIQTLQAYISSLNPMYNSNALSNYVKI